ncbi:MAG: TonB-dependent receptor [Gammaproteobacteria bacterium]|nr:TonB-dependent receptor [Gammaproteobacteria bacterium]
MKFSTLLTRLTSGTVGAVIGLGLVPAAYAAELEEVIVTAQKRAEDVQDVPIAITAITGEAMEAKAINQVAEVGDFAPNVYLDPTTPFSASNNVLGAYIRGIGQSDFAFNLEPGVGVYVDGVYLARTVAANVDLLDVERLEVLKGPQGTLFGRNTIGGAVNVITRRPGNEFAYRGEVTTGSYKRLDVRGAVEGSIIKDTLYGLVAFSAKNRDGYQERERFPGIEGNADDRYDQFLQADYKTDSAAGGENQHAVRGKLLWEVNDDLDVMVVGAYNSVDEQATPNSLLSYLDDPASLTSLYDACISLPSAVLQAIPIPPCFLNRGIKPGLPAIGAPGVQQPALNGANADADPNNNRTLFGNNPGGFGSAFIHPNKDKSYANGPNFNITEVWDVYGHIDYDLANDWHVKYIGGYRSLHWKGGFDFDGSPLPMLEPSFDTKQEQYSNELQLSGLSWEDRWKWVLGFYQFHEEGDLTDYVTFPGGLLQIFGRNFFDTDAWAVFTHNNFALTDKIGLTFGARYTDEDKDFEGQQRDLNMIAVNPFLPLGTGCIGPPGCSLDAFPDQNDFTRYYPLGVNNKGFTDLSLRAGIEYHFTDDMMGYFSYAEGFKSGGWTTRLSTPHLSTEPNAFQPLGLEFDEETATSYELGLKSQLFDRTLQLNLAGFFTQYDNIQVTKQVGASPVFDNAGDGEIWGFEAEAVWLATDNLTFEGSVGWMDAEYTSIDAGVNKNVGIVGVTPLTTSDSWNNVPEWDINLSGTYTFPLASGAHLAFRGDWSHTSEMVNDLSNTPELSQGDLNFVNLSLTYTNPSDNWDLIVGGRNVTDERHIVVGQVQPAAGMINGTWNRPAEWFLTLRVRN